MGLSSLQVSCVLRALSSTSLGLYEHPPLGVLLLGLDLALSVLDLGHLR